MSTNIDNKMNNNKKSSTECKNKINVVHTSGSLSKKSLMDSSDYNAEDIILKVIGDFGKWQFWTSVSMALLKLPLAWYQLNIIFMAPPQDFWCLKPAYLTSLTEQQWRKICAPMIEEYPCLIFDPDILLIMPNMERELLPLVKCPKFGFNVTVFSRTIASDWNLVCSEHWLIHFTQCVMMWGVLIGGIIFGIIADKYGRKISLMVAITIQCVASYITCFLPWYWIFLVNWFILALASGGIGIISFVLSMEAVGGKWRTIIPIVYQLPFGLGNTVMAVLAYWLRDWRKLEFALATLSSLFLIYWVTLSESPRWLIATVQNEKALEVLEKAAKQNKREKYYLEAVPILIKYNSQKRNDPGFMALMKSKTMRMITCLLCLNWFCTGLEFYTFSQYLGLIGSNIFLTVALSGLISVSGGIACLFIVTKVGRKTTAWVFQVLTAFCLVLILMIPKDVFVNDWPRLLLAGLGFAGLAGSVPALYLFSGELFPTLERNAGVGGVTTFARVAAMVAPVVVNLEEVRQDLPLVLLAIMSFLQLALLVPLPETKGQPLLDTLEQAEEFYKTTNTGFKSINKTFKDKAYKSLLSH